MSALLDSSVLVAALAQDENRHRECLDLLTQGEHAVHPHAFLETFSALTGGRLGMRVAADLAAQLLGETVFPRVRVIELAMEDVLAALRLAKAQGVRGGGVYDYLHLVAARKAKVDILYTLNLGDFLPLRREGDPELRRP